MTTLNSSERSKARSAAYMAKKGLIRVNGRIVSATEATKASARAPIVKPAPAAKSATSALRAMTDAEAVTHHRDQGVAALQRGAAAMGVRGVIAATTSQGAAASAATAPTPAKPAALSQAEIDAGWAKAAARINGDKPEIEPASPWASVIAKMNARLNGVINHGRR